MPSPITAQVIEWGIGREVGFVLSSVTMRIVRECTGVAKSMRAIIEGLEVIAKDRELWVHSETGEQLDSFDDFLRNHLHRFIERFHLDDFEPSDPVPTGEWLHHVWVNRELLCNTHRDQMAHRRRALAGHGGDRRSGKHSADVRREAAIVREMRAEGKTQRQIAAELGVSEQRVSKRLKVPDTSPDQASDPKVESLCVTPDTELGPPAESPQPVETYGTTKAYMLDRLATAAEQGDPAAVKAAEEWVADPSMSMAAAAKKAGIAKPRRPRIELSDDHDKVAATIASKRDDVYALELALDLIAKAQPSTEQLARMLSEALGVRVVLEAT